MERSVRKKGPVIDPKWDPAQGEVPRPDIITEAMECSQNGTYHDCPLKDPRSSWRSQMQLFASNQWTEAAEPCSWIRGKLEEAEEEGKPVRGLAVSTHLDTQDLSDTGPPTRKHTPSVMSVQHIYSRGLLILVLVREDVPNSQENGGLLNDYHEENERQQMLARMWGKRPLVTVGKSVSRCRHSRNHDVLKKLKTELLYGPAVPLLHIEYVPKGLYILLQRYLHIHIQHGSISKIFVEWNYTNRENLKEFLLKARRQECPLSFLFSIVLEVLARVIWQEM